MAIYIESIKGSFSIGGKTFKGARNVVIANDGSITINGKPASEYNVDDSSILKVVINGDVENISTEDSDIEVKGKVGTITSHNGNVTCSDVEGDVSTKNGNIVCRNIKGEVVTKNGNIISQ